MMYQQFQQPEPPNKVNTFMEKFGLPALLVIFTIIATIIGTVLLGKIQVLDFNWLLLVLILILLVITILFAWYNIRTRRILKKKHQEDIATMKKDMFDFKQEMRQMVIDETTRSNNWKIAFSQAIAKEQAEHLQDAKNEFKKVIADAKAELTEAIHQDYLNWNKWVHDHAGAHEQQKKEQKEQLGEVKKQLDEGIENVSRTLAARIQNNWNSTTNWQNDHNVAHGKEQQIYKDQLEALEKKLTNKQLSESDN